jgi:hypothetical protein
MRLARPAATCSKRRTFCSRLRRHALRVLWVLGEPPSDSGQAGSVP